MFLLFLIGLGTASLSAQVRIGGNTPPNASAVLDLNADGTNSGTKGLALPRVALTSNTMLLSGVTANLTGMLVYNTSTTGGAGVNAIGIYYWNGANWIRASMPSTSPGDSGYILMSTGTGVAWTGLYSGTRTDTSRISTLRSRPVSVSMIVDTTIDITSVQNTITFVSLPGITMADECYMTSGSMAATLFTNSGSVSIMRQQSYYAGTTKLGVRCIRTTEISTNNVAWILAFSGTVAVPALSAGSSVNVSVTGVAAGDFCHEVGINDWSITASGNNLHFSNTLSISVGGRNALIKCYRPSI